SAPPAATAAPQLTPREGGTFTTSHWPSNINPLLNSGSDWGFARFVYNGLVISDAKLETILPALAEKWTTSPDGRGFAFTIRKDVKWDDGQPLTAKDVEFTYQRVMDSRVGAPRSAFLRGLKGSDAYAAGKTDRFEGVAAPDDYTVQLTLSEPSGAFLGSLTG